jgi:hypothetical protein
LRRKCLLKKGDEGKSVATRKQLLCVCVGPPPPAASPTC